MDEPRQTTAAAGPGASAPGPPAAGRSDADAAADEDRRLIAAVQAGDHDALGALYDVHAPAMLGLAIRILHDRGDAEDLVHDVFIEAWRKAASFSGERGRVRTWLLLRVRSRAIDRLRTRDVARRHARRETRAPSPATSPAPADSPDDGPDRQRARAALGALPAPQRTVLELAYFEGLSCSEIASRCDTPLGTVKSRLLAGMRTLRHVFEAGEVRDAAR